MRIKNKKWWIVLIAPLIPAISLIAAACSKAKVPEELIKDRSTPIKINPPYSIKENTAEEIYKDAKLDENHQSKVFSIDSQKYSDVKYKFLDIKIDKLENGTELIVLTVEAKFDDYDVPHIYSHNFLFLTKKQKEIKTKRAANEAAIKNLIDDEEKNGLNFFKIKIKKEYQSKSVDDIKIAGDDALLINNQQSDFVAKPIYEGISFKIIDLNITYYNNLESKPKLIARLEINKGENEEEVKKIHSFIIDY